jgi:hypothetical protein
MIVVGDKNRDFVLCGCFGGVAEKYMWPKSIWPSLVSNDTREINTKIAAGRVVMAALSSREWLDIS